MNPTHEVPPDRTEAGIEAKANGGDASQCLRGAPVLPPAPPKAASTKPPTLLESFYHWLMSRS